MKKPLLYLIFIISSYALKVSAHSPPIADFSVTNLCFGDSSRFINQSIGGFSSMWVIQKWDVALNDTITIDTLYTTDLTYLFSLQGTYYITLYQNNGHIASITKEVLIGNNTKASFSFQSCTNQFINMSTCSTTFLWNFGDGDTSSVALPVHQYADTGTYIVTLIASNGITTDTITNSIVITVLGYANPIYQIIASNDTVYCKITGGIWSTNSLTWYFSDGATANSVDTFHVFQDTGSYYVSIRVFNSCGMFYRDTLITISNLTTGIKQYQSTTSSFILYPNPARDILKIKSTSKEPIKSIAIYNLMGQKELEEKNIKDKLDISQLQSGSYLMYIKTESELHYNKFIKE